MIKSFTIAFVLIVAAANAHASPKMSFTGSQLSASNWCEDRPQSTDRKAILVHAKDHYSPIFRRAYNTESECRTQLNYLQQAIASNQGIQFSGDTFKIVNASCVAEPVLETEYSVQVEGNIRKDSVQQKLIQKFNSAYGNHTSHKGYSGRFVLGTPKAIKEYTGSTNWSQTPVALAVAMFSGGIFEVRDSAHYARYSSAPVSFQLNAAGKKQMKCDCLLGTLESAESKAEYDLALAKAQFAGCIAR